MDQGRTAERAARGTGQRTGLVHLLGTVAYLRIAEIPELPYKTTLLGGQLEVGVVGVAFVALTDLDVAAVGAVVDVVILLALALGPAVLSHVGARPRASS